MMLLVTIACLETSPMVLPPGRESFGTEPKNGATYHTAKHARAPYQVRATTHMFR